MFLSDDERGVTKGELAAEGRRDPLSKWLPYLSYNEDSELYINSDNTVGYIYECTPAAFSSEGMADTIAGLLRQEFPEQTVISFMLYPDDDVEHIFQRHLACTQRKDPVTLAAGEHYCDHLRSGIKNMQSLGGVPIRNFRLLVSVKAPEILDADLKAHVFDSLQEARLGPMPVKPGRLLKLLRRIFNYGADFVSDQYNDDVFIRDQIIRSENPVEPEGNKLKVGNRVAGCLTPKVLTDFDALTVNTLIGGFMGKNDDSSQLANQFIWTTNIFFRTKQEDVKSKASMMMMQRAGGTIAKELGRRVSELNWVVDDIKKNKYCDVIASLWVFGDDEKELSKGVARAKGLWEKAEFEMQREQKVLLPSMFIQALPFGLYLGEKYRTVAVLNRDFPMSIKAASRLIPIQGDFSGGMKPVMLLVGRKGQLVGIDVFDERANNNNYLICAESGAGKSFSNNFLVSSYYASGALIRLVDIGYSYQKQALLRKGRFIDVGAEFGKLVLNPFSSVANVDSEDAAQNRATVSEILMAMVYSRTGVANVTETQQTLMKHAVDFAYARDGGEFGIQHVHEYLKTYPALAEGGAKLDTATPIANEMAFNLADWIPGGRYGAMFNGKSTFNIAADDFVVLELEQLLNDRELFGVVSLQVLNAITQDLYLSDRSSKRFMLFDEAWKYLISNDGEKTAGSSATGAIAAIIEEGYRRARKYHGSTGIVTQSPLDLGNMGQAGQVIKANSAFKCWLQCDAEQWALARDKKIVSYSGLRYDLAVSVKSNKPKYSEIFFDTPFGSGVSRLTVDPWTYWVNTSDPKDYARFKAEYERVGDPLVALNNLSGKQ